MHDACACDPGSCDLGSRAERGAGIVLHGADQSGDIEDQRHGAVPEDGCAADAVNLAEVAFQALDHDLLLAEHLVHEQADATGVRLHHHQQAPGE